MSSERFVREGVGFQCGALTLRRKVTRHDKNLVSELYWEGEGGGGQKRVWPGLLKRHRRRRGRGREEEGAEEEGRSL